MAVVLERFENKNDIRSSSVELFGYLGKNGAEGLKFNPSVPNGTYLKPWARGGLAQG